MHTIGIKVISALERRRLSVLAAFATVCALVMVPGLVRANELDATTPMARQAEEVFYTTSDVGHKAEVFAIHVRERTVTVRDVGQTNGGDCISLAWSRSGKLYSMCGQLFGVQQLATIDPNNGRAHLFGVPVSGLAVMAIGFGRNGILYAVGDCNPDSNFECMAGADPNYNSLYTVNVQTGAFSRVGSTGAPQFFMDLALGSNGDMFGVTTTVKPSMVPAVLYRIDIATGKATKITNLVGSNSIMGLAFGEKGRLYATDFTQNPGLYIVDPKTGFETAIAALPFGLSSGLELLSTHDGRSS